MKLFYNILSSPVILLTLASGMLISACSTVTVHRAALVQPPALPMWSGKTRPSGFSAGNSTVLWNNAPKNSPESNSGLFISSTQFDGTIHFQLGPTQKISLWLPVNYGLSGKSFAAAPCMVSRPANGNISGGVGIGFSSMVSRHWYLGTSVETLVGLIPSHIKTYSDETDILREDKNDYSVVPVIRWSGAAGVDFEWVRLFGTVGFRNHPTNTKITQELSGDNHGDVQFGPIYALLGVGAEFNLADNMSILAQLYQPLPLYEDDVIYGPMAGLSLDIHSSRKPG